MIEREIQWNKVQYIEIKSEIKKMKWNKIQKKWNYVNCI